MDPVQQEAAGAQRQGAVDQCHRPVGSNPQRGNKRRIVSDEQRRQILDIYAAGETSALSRMLDYRTFGYRRIKVLRPLLHDLGTG